MGTRSAVGTISVDHATFRGRYVHWDGYPGSRGPDLTEIIAKVDGDLARVVKTLTEDYYGWSSLRPNIVAGDDSSLGERGVAVAGFGEAYTTAQGQSAPDDWIDITVGVLGKAWDIEWAYGFTGTDPATAELVVLVVTRGTFHKVTAVPVREMHRADWSQIEEEGNDIRFAQHEA